jgi:DNA-binding LacI/PurR family transcriptional regulator
MQDVAKAAGVSKNTVSLALRNSPEIPPKTRGRIAQLAKRMGYRKNPTVAHLMAQLRSNAPGGYKATLAIINAHQDRNAFTSHPTIPIYVKGCRRRATQSGYSLDEFWLHEEGLDGTKLNRILRSRNIRGVIVAGLMKDNYLPERFLTTWNKYPCVVTGVRTRDPALPFACTDHHILAMRAVENALRLGYRRPGLVLDGTIDRLVEFRFTSGYLTALKQLPDSNRLNPFYQVDEARIDPTLFEQWYRNERPDVILTLYHEVQRWLGSMNLTSPRDVGLIQLEWRSDHPHWAGVCQHNDIVGEMAVEMVISMIHHNENGISPFPRATLIGSTWIDGSTVRIPLQKKFHCFVEKR